MFIIKSSLIKYNKSNAKFLLIPTQSKYKRSHVEFLRTKKKFLRLNHSDQRAMITVFSVCHILDSHVIIDLSRTVYVVFKKSPRTSPIMQIIFSFWSFEISEGILRNPKIIISLDSFSNQRIIYLAPFGLNSLCIDYPVESCKITVILFGSMLPNP